MIYNSDLELLRRAFGTLGWWKKKKQAELADRTANRVTAKDTILKVFLNIKNYSPPYIFPSDYEASIILKSLQKD
mgnify:CR=1 FL=1